MTQNTQNINDTLDNRARTYGDYDDHARITQNIKAAMADSGNWSYLPPHLKETLEMVAHKLGRMLNGDWKYLDTARDCIGYMKLSYDLLEKTNDATDAKITYIIRTPDGWKQKDGG